MVILPPIPRNERRLMKKMAQKTHDKKYAIRILSILMIHRGKPVFHVSETLCVAQSSVWRWIKSFRTYGWLGLQTKPSGRHQRWNLTSLLHKTDPEYEEKMKQINQALLGASKEHPVFYEDEVDIHFNPKIGSDWYLKGQQKRIITLGKNQKILLCRLF
ncbi:integrase [Xenorhabdus ishibashii]|uniref:Integrase n=1 Tax=Xenorhabdus ishibashii TaxID=1034471 RepID=A0A2D0KK42_9GAMM|nr:integrase [Xenorhabdus ishibashii]